MAQHPVQTVPPTVYFQSQLKNIKALVDSDLDRYWDARLHTIETVYGDASARSVGAFADITRRGGKRIRAALAMQAYELFGGQDDTVRLGMARALELIHAYLLVIDDISDRSELRRGDSTAHIMLAKWHQAQGLAGDSEHLGESLAILAALHGAHQAMREISSLPVDPERRLTALDNLNELLIVTAHGQMNDLYNEALATTDEARVEDVLLWKTAYYTFVNPLQFGAILAGAEQPALKQLKTYALQAGRAFQISDDIIGVFGNEAAAGKSPMDDIKEGKRTLLTLHALENASAADAEFLESMLGNRHLREPEFDRCRRIIADSGALQASQDELKEAARDAIAALHGGVLDESSPTVSFLEGLAQYLTEREA